MRLSLAIPVAGLVLLSMSAAVADTGSPTQTEQLKFPYLLKIGAGNVLIVHGRQMSGSVTITWAAGDTVRINGVGVYPPPRVPPKQFSEQELADVYGKVPLVRDIVKTGATWHVAVAKYNERREDLGLRMNMLYWAVMDSTGSHGAAARAVLDSVDRSLLTPGSEPRVSRSSLIVDWDGMGEEYVDIGERATESKQRPWVLSDEDTQQYVQLLVRQLEPAWNEPYLVFISPRGRSFQGGKLAAQAIQQIESAKKGIRSKGPLGEADLDEVIKAYGGKRP